jgi:hypothetical protein
MSGKELKELTIMIHEGDERLSALHVTAQYQMIINKELLESTVYNAVKKLGYEVTPWQVLDSAEDDPFDYGRGG